MKRLLAFVCYSAILVDALFVLFLVANGALGYSIPGTRIPIPVPPFAVLVALIAWARKM